MRMNNIRISVVHYIVFLLTLMPSFIGANDKLTDYLKQAALSPQTQSLSAQGVMFLMGMGSKIAFSILAKVPVYPLGDGIKSLLGKDPKVVPAAELIDHEKKMVAKGFESSLRKAFGNFLKQSLSGTKDQINKLMGAYTAGLDSTYAMDLMTEMYDYVARKGLKERLDELTQVSTEYAKPIVNALFATYPELRNDFAYPIKTSHSTMLYCGPQDPYCLKSAGPVEKALDLTGITLSPQEIAEAFTSAISFEHVDPFAAGFLFSVVSFDFATAVAPLLAQALMDPSSYTTIAPLIEKFIEKWTASEVYDVLSRWYSSNYIDKGFEELSEKNFEQKVRIGSLARLVQTSTVPSLTNFVKNIVASVGGK